MIRPAAEKRIPVADDPQFRTVEVRVLGDRNNLITRTTLPVERLPDIESAWQHWHRKYPAYTLEEFLRYILIKGTIVAVRRVAYNTIPPPKEFRSDSS